MTKCKVCGSQLTSDAEMCTACAQQLGITPGAGVRRLQPCARCNHGQLVRALVRELTVDPGADTNDRVAVPMAVTYAPALVRSFWTDEVKGARGADESRPFGILEMYVCRKCGFAEWYCRNPGDIPIGSEFGTEIVDVGSSGPYR